MIAALTDGQSPAEGRFSQVRHVLLTLSRSGSDRHTFYDVVRGSGGDDVVHLEPGLRK